jgi:hypothetical protein
VVRLAAAAPVTWGVFRRIQVLNITGVEQFLEPSPKMVREFGISTSTSTSISTTLLIVLFACSGHQAQDPHTLFQSICVRVQCSVLRPRAFYDRWTMPSSRDTQNTLHERLDSNDFCRKTNRSYTLVEVRLHRPSPIHYPATCMDLPGSN